MILFYYPALLIQFNLILNHSSTQGIRVLFDFKINVISLVFSHMDKLTWSTSDTDKLKYTEFKSKSRKKIKSGRKPSLSEWFLQLIGNFRFFFAASQ